MFNKKGFVLGQVCNFFFGAVLIEHVQQSNRVSSTDYKRLRDNALYYLPGLTEETRDILLPSKAVLSSTRVKGTKMAIMSFVVGKGHNPPVLIVDEKDNVIFPTMFTLWNMRSIVPTLFIRPETWQFLARGADLMLPGVLRPEALGLPPYAPFVIGSVWSVSIVPPQESGIAPIPVAVGGLLSLFLPFMTIRCRL